MPVQPLRTQPSSAPHHSTQTLQRPRYTYAPSDVRLRLPPRVDLALPHVSSLKEKRRVVKSLMRSGAPALRRVVAEIADQDVHRRAVLLCALVGGADTSGAGRRARAFRRGALSGWVRVRARPAHLGRHPRVGRAGVWASLYVALAMAGERMRQRQRGHAQGRRVGDQRRARGPEDRIRDRHRSRHQPGPALGARATSACSATRRSARTTLAALRSAHGVLQSAIARETRIKYTPTLSFSYDEGPERAVRLAQLLEDDRVEAERRRTSESGDARPRSTRSSRSSAPASASC